MLRESCTANPGIVDFGQYTADGVVWKHNNHDVRLACLYPPASPPPCFTVHSYAQPCIGVQCATCARGRKKTSVFVAAILSCSALNSLVCLGYSRILLDADCYFTRLQERIEERIAKYTSETEGWLESDALMLRLRELCDAAVAEHGAVKYDELMGTLNEEFGPATVQERQEPIKKVVTAYPGHSIVRSQNL